MSNNKNLNEQVDKFILDNPRKPNEVGYYGKIAELFGIHPEKARKRWRMLQRQGALVKKEVEGVKVKSIYGDMTNGKYVPYQLKTPDESFPVTNPTERKFQVKSNGTGSIQASTSEKIENLKDLIRVCAIDTDKYNVVDYSVKSYNAWIRNEMGAIETKQLYSVHANLKIKRIDDTVSKQRDLILNAIKAASIVKEKPTPVITQTIGVAKNCALEINIPDLHIGKLAWGKETGEDYDIKIAVERYKKAVYELLSRVNTQAIEKFILPVGNDMINVDNKGNTTTAGTNVSCDSRFGKMFQTAKELLIDTIDNLSGIAPVEVIIVPGNHDTVAMFTLGEVLDAWYHNNELVTVINTHTPRKYLQYGSNLLMYCHGHNEKLQDLGIICATEQPQLWAATKFRRVHVGHFHHSKQIKFIDVQEYPGFTVKVLNSLSANDAWHAEKGYNSLKGAEAFLYHKDKGLIANYFYLNQKD
jgi:hypothetical protein